jgi:hypothetical protein
MDLNRIVRSHVLNYKRPFGWRDILPIMKFPGADFLYKFISRNIRPDYILECIDIGKCGKEMDMKLSAEIPEIIMCNIVGNILGCHLIPMINNVKDEYFTCLSKTKMDNGMMIIDYLIMAASYCCGLEFVAGLISDNESYFNPDVVDFVVAGLILSDRRSDFRCFEELHVDIDIDIKSVDEIAGRLKMPLPEYWTVWKKKKVTSPKPDKHFFLRLLDKIITINY